MDMRTDLTAVPHAGLGFQFLRVQVRKPKRKWRSIKFSEAIKSKGDPERSTDRMTSSAHICSSKKTSNLRGSWLSLTPFGKLENCRYVRMISPNIPLCDLASLNWVSHRVPSSPAARTHTHTHLTFSTFLEGTSMKFSTWNLSLDFNTTDWRLNVLRLAF